MEKVEKRSLSIVITGATSGLGRAVTRLLVARGHRVVGVAPSTLAAAELHRSDGGVPVYCDPFDRDAMKSALMMARADVAMHLAGQVVNAPPQVAVDWRPHLRTLHKGAETVIEAAGYAHTRRVLYPSFAFLYGDQDGAMADEDTPPLRTGNPAFEAALKAEAAVLDGGVPGYVLRAGYLYGPYSGGTRALYDALRAGKPLPRSDGYACWIHEDDLALALALAAEREVEREATDYIYNIVDNTPASPTQFANTFAEALGLPHPGAPSRWMARLRRNPLQEALLAMSLRASNGLAEAELDWEPRFGDHRAGIEHTLLTWRAGADKMMEDVL